MLSLSFVRFFLLVCKNGGFCLKVFSDLVFHLFPFKLKMLLWAALFLSSIFLSLLCFLSQHRGGLWTPSFYYSVHENKCGILSTCCILPLFDYIHHFPHTNPYPKSPGSTPSPLIPSVAACVLHPPFL